MIRAFVAVDISDDVRTALADAQGRLKRANVGVKISWTKVENVHITLQFLGYVEDEAVAKIGAVLERIVAEHPAFELDVRGAGAFPDERRARVLWVGCEDAHGKLKALAQAVQAAMQPLGFEPEHREFSAHLTLGRIKPAPMKSGFPKPDAALTKALDSVKNQAFGTMRVDAVHLFQSQLHSEGSIYSKLSSHRLRE